MYFAATEIAARALARSAVSVGGVRKVHNGAMMVSLNRTNGAAISNGTTPRFAPRVAAPKPGAVEDQLVALVRKYSLRYRAIRLKRGVGIYNAGDSDRTMYFLEEGMVRISIPTAAGRSCLLEIHRSPMFFGEIAGVNGERADMAVARTSVLLRKIPGEAFFEMLKAEDLVQTFAVYLSARLSEYQQIITDFVTCSAEERLAATLLRLGRKLGHTESGELCLRERLSCQELSEMVGTTRSRVGYFLGRFRQQHFVAEDSRRHLRIREDRLKEYLSERA
jgi:CRP/FNR family transcriptional regulator, cyclic AMP receptor protein